jgi:hypothetical protein
VRDGLTVRRRVTFAALLLPLVLFLALRLWNAAHLDRWAQSADPLSFVIQLGLVIDNWALRITP